MYVISYNMVLTRVFILFHCILFKFWFPLVQVYYKQRDYWPFVWCIRYISPHLASHVEQVFSLLATCCRACKHI